MSRMLTDCIYGPKYCAPSHQADGGEILVHVHAQEGIGLVVLQQDVILGRVLLDEVVLGDESVHLARADDIAKIGDVGEHRHHLRRLVAGLIKILLQPRFEALGFADVDDLSVLVLISPSLSSIK